MVTHFLDCRAPNLLAGNKSFESRYQSLTKLLDSTLPNCDPIAIHLHRSFDDLLKRVGNTNTGSESKCATSIRSLSVYIDSTSCVFVQRAFRASFLLTHSRRKNVFGGECHDSHSGDGNSSVRNHLRSTRQGPLCARFRPSVRCLLVEW